MDGTSLQGISAAVAPVVMVSASGLLFLGVQNKNLHLSDRVRGLAAEHRSLGTDPQAKQRREQIREQLVYFERRIRFSQRALELLQIAIFCFVATSLALASTAWLTSMLVLTVSGVLFFAGVGAVVAALVFEFLEMHTGLRTIGIEMTAVLRESRHD